ncbi:LacI family transcriptional regulator [Plantibacter flavus]|uniref:LacI family DNA-binding transcriptional regulator n=1 Tax=Plantibacter flavus TaxID=150123 RepID=UPI003F1605DF
MTRARDDQSPARATIIDVARVAGVSRQTVTRSLNGMRDVSAATRQRVIEVAASLNYRPNRAAQHLVSGRTTTLGLVVDDLRNPYYPELAAALVQQASERGWTVLVAEVGGPVETERAQLTELARQVDAVVGRSGADRVGLEGAFASVPFVSLGTDHDAVDGGDAATRVAGVDIDFEAGIRAAVAHLAATGRRSIAMIDASEVPSGRRLAYRQQLRELDLPWSEASETWAEDTHQGGVAAAERCQSALPDVDAVLVFNDVMAVGVLKGFARAGVRVPEDVAVVGVDGLDLGRFVTPELTSIAVDKVEIARASLELLDGMIAGSLPLTGPLVRRSVGVSLVLRESA